MGLFSKPKTQTSSGAVRCTECGKIIRAGRKVVYIRGEPYCVRCAEDELDWEFLEIMEILDE